MVIFNYLGLIQMAEKSTSRVIRLQWEAESVQRSLNKLASDTLHLDYHPFNILVILTACVHCVPVYLFIYAGRPCPRFIVHIKLSVRRFYESIMTKITYVSIL